jgi:hypothetical protein
MSPPAINNEEVLCTLKLVIEIKKGFAGSFAAIRVAISGTSSCMKGWTITEYPLGWQSHSVSLVDFYISTNIVDTP